MKKAKLILGTLSTLMIASSLFAQAEIERWKIAGNRTRNLVTFIESKINQIPMGGRAQCHRVENAQQCVHMQGCYWDAEFDICGYQQQHFRGFESDLESEEDYSHSDEEFEPGVENDVVAGISLALISAKNRKISQDIDLAIAYYPQAIAYQYRDRACKRLRSAMAGTGALSLTLLIPNENNTPHILTPADFGSVIEVMKASFSMLCY